VKISGCALIKRNIHYNYTSTTVHSNLPFLLLIPQRFWTKVTNKLIFLPDRIVNTTEENRNIFCVFIVRSQKAWETQKIKITHHCEIDTAHTVIAPSPVDRVRHCMVNRFQNYATVLLFIDIIMNT